MFFRDPSFAEAIDYEPARAVYGVWSAAWQNDALPGKQALTAPHIPMRALPGVFVHEELGVRFRCRLTGSDLDQAYGENGAGKYLDERLSGEALESRLALMRRCLNEQKAVLFAGQLAGPEREHIQTRRLLLPVREESAGTRLIVGVAWFPEGYRLRGVFERASSVATLVALERPSQG